MMETNFKQQLLTSLGSLRAYAVSLCGNRDLADDLVQETVTKAWAKQTSFTLGTNMKAWLFTILRHEFYGQMRKAGREVSDEDGVLTNNLSQPPDQHGKLDLKDFQTALETLPDKQREAIVLVGASGFSYEEAAEICNCAVGTIKSRVSRARSALQEKLDISGKEDYGPDDISKTVPTF